MGWKRIVGKGLKYAGKAVGKEAGLIPDETELSDKTLAELFDVISEAVAAGVYSAMKRVEEENLAQFKESLARLQAEKGEDQSVPDPNAFRNIKLN